VSGHQHHHGKRTSRSVFTGTLARLDILIEDDLPETPEIQAALRQGMGLFVGEIRRRAIRNVSGGVVQRRRGRLAASIQASVAQAGTDTVGVVSSDSFVGRLLEYGTAPHPIFARRARLASGRRRARKAGPSLAFSTGFRTLFRRGVKHPGVRPTRWFSRAAAEVLPQAPVIFDAELQKAING